MDKSALIKLEKKSNHYFPNHELISSKGNLKSHSNNSNVIFFCIRNLILLNAFFAGLAAKMSD